MPTCSNGHTLDEYPDEYRSAERVGVNFRGWVEYIDEDAGIVYEYIYPVDDTRWPEEIRTHDMIGETVDEHVNGSQSMFGPWRHVEERQ